MYYINQGSSIRTSDIYTISNVSPIFAGDGDLRQEVEKTAKDDGLSRKVVFLGNCDDVARLYSAFDIFVLPSIYEGFPLAAIEAQANGLPIIASSSIDSTVKINENFRFLGLESGPKKWAEVIDSMDDKRVIPEKKLDEFSVERMIREITRIYSGLGG